MKCFRKIRSIQDATRIIKHYYPVPFEELQTQSKEIGAQYLAFAVSAIGNAPIKEVRSLIDKLVFGESFTIEGEHWHQAPGIVKVMGFLRHIESGLRFGSCILGVRYYE